MKKELRQRAENWVDSSRLSKKQFLIVFGALFLGTGTATVVTLVSPTVQGSGTVSNGFGFDLQDVSGAATDSDSSDRSFTADMSQGSVFGFDVVKQNLANDKTQPLAEVTVISSDSEDLNHKTLEQVEFDAVQRTAESDGSSVPQGTTVNMTVDVAADGSITRNGDAETYMRLASADVNSDSLDEILVCIGDNDDQTVEASGSDGMQFGPSEKWEGSYSVDTQTGFPDTTVSTESGMHLMLDPTTGSVPSPVSACPQFS